MITYKGQRFNTLDDLYAWLQAHPEEYKQFYEEAPSWMKQMLDTLSVYDDFLHGNASANDVLLSAGESGAQIDPTAEKALDNIISRENTENAQQFEEHMRDTNITSSASQYAAAGLSPSSVVQGGISTSNGVGAANNVLSSSASIKQRERLAKYNQTMGMAKQVVGLVGNMASSGIYGHAIGAVKNAASKVAGATAHSGLSLLNSMKGNMGDFYKTMPLPEGSQSGGNNSPIGY